MTPFAPTHRTTRDIETVTPPFLGRCGAKGDPVPAGTPAVLVREYPGHWVAFRLADDAVIVAMPADLEPIAPGGGEGEG